MKSYSDGEFERIALATANSELRSQVKELEAEIKRLRAENQAFRDQFRDVDELLAEWEGHTPMDPPPGWERVDL